MMRVTGSIHRQVNPGSGRRSSATPSKRRRLQVWLDHDTAAVVTALAAQRRHSHSRVAAALIAAALKDFTDGEH
jgi:hypothetical protein